MAADPCSSTDLRVEAVIAAGHPSLPGHFPGAAVVPGVVVLDAVVQAAERGFGAFRLCGIPAVKFLRPLLPDQRFDIAIERRSDALWTFRCESADGVFAQGSLAIASGEGQT
ncbi:MAG: hypothetical protein ACT4QA_02070 [Panacagrimonas sp.]